MASSYTRTFSKATGNTILAADFNTEFQLIDDAFSESSGHKHDGSSNEGAYIPKISDTNNYTAVEIDSGNAEIDFNINVASAKVRQLVLADGALLPDTDNDVDLGSTTYEFKNLYIDGVANIDTLAADAATLAAATITSATVTGFATSVVPTTDDAIDLGSTSKGWQSLYLTDDITFDGTANVANIIEFQENTGTYKSLWFRHIASTNAFDLSKYDSSDGSTVLSQLVMQDDGTLTLLSTQKGTIVGGYALTTATQGVSLLELDGYWDGNTVASMIFQTGSDTTNKDSGQIAFQTYDAAGSVGVAMTLWEDRQISTGGVVPLGATQGSMTIGTGDSGVDTISSGYDDLIIESDGSCGITLSAPNSVIQGIAFATPASSVRGLFYWQDSSSLFQFYGNGKTAFSIACSSLNNIATGVGFNFVIQEGDLLILDPTVPASASDTGDAGTISWDSNYIYVCTATDTWKRAALSTW